MKTLRQLIFEHLYSEMEELVVPNSATINRRFDSHPNKDAAVDYLHKRELENSFSVQLLHAKDKVFYVPFNAFRSMRIDTKSTNGPNDIEGSDVYKFNDKGQLAVMHPSDHRNFPVLGGSLNIKFVFEFYLTTNNKEVDRIESDIEVSVYLNFKANPENYRQFIIEPAEYVKIDGGNTGVMKVLDRNGANKLAQLINGKIHQYFYDERGQHGKKIMDKFVMSNNHLVNRNQLMTY